MSKFQPKGSSSESGVAKFVAGAGVPILEKVGAGESELGIAGQVQHRTGDGIVHDLARLLNSFYMSLPRDPRLHSQAEKEDLYRQIVAAMEAEGAVTDYGKDLARRMAGLDTLDGQVDSRQFQGASSQAQAKENGGYRMPQEPANRPSSVAKSDQEFMRDVRRQILEVSQRIQLLVAKQSGR